MKNHRSKSLLLHYSINNSNSVKFVHPAQQIEVRKEEQKVVLLFLVAEDSGKREIDRLIFVMYAKY